MKTLARVVLVLALLPLASSDARADAPDPPPIDRERLASALARYAHEPSVDEIVRTALATHVADPARAREAIERARLAGLAPMLRAGVRRGLATDLAQRQTTTTELGSWNSGDELALVGTLTFRLDRLVFASEESSLLAEERRLEDARLELVREVVRLYFERRRLQLERDLLERIDLAAEIRIAECGALLDVLTDGAFSRMVASRAPHEEDD